MKWENSFRSSAGGGGLPLGARLAIDIALGLAAGRGNFEEAAGDEPVQQQEECGKSSGHNAHRQPVARADAAKEIQRIGTAPDGRAVDGGIRNEVLNEGLRPEIEEIVGPEEHERDENGDKALVFELQADLRDDPAERAREREHKQGDERDEQHAAGDGCRAGRDHDPVDDDRREDDNAGIHQAHEVDAEQAEAMIVARGGHGDGGRYLAEIEAGTRIEQRCRTQPRKTASRPISAKKSQSIPTADSAPQSETER